MASADRIAVCLSGHPRTLERAHVHASIASALLSGLRAHARVDLFAVLGVRDAPTKVLKAFYSYSLLLPHPLPLLRLLLLLRRGYEDEERL